MNEKDMSRRDFLKIVGISTATATAATLAGCGPKGAGNNETGAGTVPVGKMDYRTNPKTGERVTLTVRDLFAIAHALGMDEMQLVGRARAVATDYALAASDDANWQEAQEQGEESE